MRVLFDVDIEIDCAVPSAPLVDGDHIVVAGGEVALLALVHRESGTVEKALFNDEPDVDVSAPVRVVCGDEHGYAFASIDRPRLHLHVTVVDRHLRVLRTRDISADDPETPELLIEGRITHFSAQHDEPEGGAGFFIVGVRDDTPTHARNGVAPTALRCVYAEDLAPRWSLPGNDVVGADRGIVVVRRADTRVLGVGVIDGAQRWAEYFGSYSDDSIVGAGDGVVAVGHQESGDELAVPSSIELRDIVTGNEIRRVAFDSGLRAIATATKGARGALLTHARRGTREVLLHVDSLSEPHPIEHVPHLVAEDVALVGPDLLLWPVDDKKPTVVPLHLSARARATSAATVDGAIVVVRDGRRLIAIQR